MQWFQQFFKVNSGVGWGICYGCIAVWNETQSNQQTLAEAQGAGSMGTLGFPRPDCSQPGLERHCVSFPGHGKASRGHCDEGVMAPGVLRHSLPQSQALGSLRALPLLLLSPGAQAEPPPVRFQENGSGCSPGSLLPKSCPLQQSQVFGNAPHLLLSSMCSHYQAQIGRRSKTPVALSRLISKACSCKTQRKQ